MFKFCESFKLYDENYKPYGIEIEACNHLWHKHIRPVERGMAIAACGNKYFLKVPSLDSFTVKYEISFNYITDKASATLYAGYERVGHSGYEIILTWNSLDGVKEICQLKLISLFWWHKIKVFGQPTNTSKHPNSFSVLWYTIIQTIKDSNSKRRFIWIVLI